MAKGARGGSVFNGPSKTGNPSGKGRGNNPSKASSFAAGGTCYKAPIIYDRLPEPTPTNAAYKSAVARLDDVVRLTHQAAEAIISARRDLSPAEAAAVESKVLAELEPYQAKNVQALLRQSEYLQSKLSQRRGTS